MFIYVVTDEKNRMHQFIYPSRVWEQDADSGKWASRPVTKEDHKMRQETCFQLVRNAASVRRLQQPTQPEPEETADES